MFPSHLGKSENFAIFEPKYRRTARARWWSSLSQGKYIQNSRSQGKYIRLLNTTWTIFWANVALFGSYFDSKPPRLTSKTTLQNRSSWGFTLQTIGFWLGAKLKPTSKVTTLKRKNRDFDGAVRQRIQVARIWNFTHDEMVAISAQIWHQSSNTWGKA